MDRNKKAVDDFKAKHADALPKTGDPCAFPGCKRKSFMAQMVGCATRTPDGKIQEHGVTYNAAGEPETRLTFALPFCHHHFMYAAEGLIAVEVSGDEKEGEPQKSIGLLAQWDMIRTMEIIAHQALFAAQIDKDQAAKAAADAEKSKAQAEHLG